mgnify:CR=1 FL=1
MIIAAKQRMSPDDDIRRRLPCAVHRALLIAAACLVACGPARTAHGADVDRGEIGSTVDDFTLRDVRGAERRYLELTAGAQAVVVAFLGTECPLAKIYAPRLARLAGQYEPRGVVFLGINSNRQDSNTEILSYARRHGVEFPMLKDVGNVVADAFAAERTPEVYLIDGQNVIRYRGRIDDQYGVGVARDHALREDLAIALDEVLASTAVTLPRTEAPGCWIGRVHAVNERGDVTWSRQVVRILQEHCQECHRPGQIGPFPLIEYEDVLGWGEMIREVVQQERMPPWHADPRYGEFVNDARMSDEEKELIYQWVADGQPQGDVSDLPPPREFADGWQIPEPDQIVYMSDEPFEVPPEGIVEYQWFEVDPGFTEDKWVKAVECRPGNPAVVHHVTVYYKPPHLLTWNLKLGERINMLGGFSPGKRPVNDPTWRGMARYVPAGSKLIFEMHYTPNGTPQNDRSSIALLFAEPEEVKKQLSVVAVANAEFAIPPGVDNHRVEADYLFDEDSILYAMSPHMHLRGKAFRFEAHYPDGTHEILLDVPNFDFNWQTDYQFTEPKRMPEGTRMHCVAHFDNSAENLANPDPSATVRWGDQTWEEMMIGALAIAPADQDVAASGGRDIRYYDRDSWTRRDALSALLGTSVAVIAVFGGGWFAWRRTHPSP